LIQNRVYIYTCLKVLGFPAGLPCVTPLARITVQCNKAGTVPGIAIRLKSLSAERLSDTVAGKINNQTQLALPSGEPLYRDDAITLPFTFTINAAPPIATFTLRGMAVIQGSEKELGEIREEISKKRVPLPVVQAALHYSLAEAVLIFRDLGVPPPISVPLPGQPKQKGGMGPTITM